jgi:hypothetical protein
MMMSSVVIRPISILRQSRLHLGSVAFGWLASPSIEWTFCDNNNNNSDKNGILDTLFPKNSDGTVSWDQARSQFTENVFWDRLATATGQKVRRSIASKDFVHILSYRGLIGSYFLRSDS